MPHQFKSNDFSLGSWVGHQRQKRGKIPLEQSDRLNELGFVWDILNAQWDEGFKNLVAYKERFGDCMVPHQFKSNDFRLGFWVANQKRRRGEMPPERVDRLNELGFVWRV